MSDRLVFVPFENAQDYDWADVVIPEGATLEQIHLACGHFAGLPGPHKVFIANRDDPRFVEFVRFMSEEYGMEQGESDWTYSVRGPRG